MTFPVSAYLQKATSRAKSDVANKLVSMFLHELSRKISSSLGLSVTEVTYAEAVATTFGSTCCYCGRELENDRVAVEHLDGMNRFRLGLHIPGNVIVACRSCNGEKRRDDQLTELVLAESGWESFLSHDSRRCAHECQNCSYWRRVCPDSLGRETMLRSARGRILSFRANYPASLEWSQKSRVILKQRIDSLYRDCQEFAAAQIRKTVDEAFSTLASDIVQGPVVDRISKGIAVGK